MKKNIWLCDVCGRQELSRYGGDYEYNPKHNGQGCLIVKIDYPETTGDLTTDCDGGRSCDFRKEKMALFICHECAHTILPELAKILNKPELAGWENNWRGH